MKRERPLPLGVIWRLWPKHDTAEIARRVGFPEYRIANALARMRDYRVAGFGPEHKRNGITLSTGIKRQA